MTHISTSRQSSSFALPQLGGNSRLTAGFAPFAGILIGYLAWNAEVAPVAATLLPLAVLACSTRIAVFLLALGYHATTVRGLAEFAANYFGGDLFLGALLWLLLAAASAVGWIVFWKPSGSSLSRSTLVVLGMLLTLLPPFASVMPGHPLIGWGYLLPGWGWTGVFTAIGASFALIYWTAASGRYLRHLIAGALLASIVSITLDTTGAELRSSEVRGVSTSLGKPPADDAQMIDRIESVRQLVLSLTRENEAGQILLFPETTLGTLDAAYAPILKSAIQRPLYDAQASAIIGWELLDGARSKNMVTLFRPDGSVDHAVQRHPALVSMWRPWSESMHFPMSFGKTNHIALNETTVGALLVCYEEFIPLMFLLDEARGEHDVALIVSNSWASVISSFPEVQRLHSLGMLKLFNRHFARAANYTAPNK